MIEVTHCQLFRRLFIAVLLLGAPLSAKEARVIKLNERTVGKITLTLGRTTILSFISKPTKVILGNRGSFGVEYIANDVAVAPLHPSARSDLFVYLENKRFAFDLETQGAGGDEIVIVQDIQDRSMKVRVQ